MVSKMISKSVYGINTGVQGRCESVIAVTKPASSPADNIATYIHS